jgi:hypothetical protein
LELRASLPAKGYINGSTTFSGLGLFRSAHPATRKAQFQVQVWPILLKKLHISDIPSIGLPGPKNPELLKIQALGHGAWT